jgi:hypothetical protein
MQFVDFNTANKIEEFSPKLERLSLSYLSTQPKSQFPSICLHVMNRIISPDHSSSLPHVPNREIGKEKVADLKLAEVGKKVLKPSYVSVLALHLREISSSAMKQVGKNCLTDSRHLFTLRLL